MSPHKMVCVHFLSTWRIVLFKDAKGVMCRYMTSFTSCCHPCVISQTVVRHIYLNLNVEILQSYRIISQNTWDQFRHIAGNSIHYRKSFWYFMDTFQNSKSKHIYIYFFHLFSYVWIILHLFAYSFMFIHVLNPTKN